MDTVASLISSKLITSIVIIIVAIIILALIGKVVSRIKKTDSVKDSVSAKALVTAIGRLIRVIFIIIIVFLIFEVNGINITSIIASLGLVGAAATLAAQDLMKDILSGIYISSEKMFSPGVFVQYNGRNGIVIDFNLRSTKIRLLDDDSIMYISNRNISEIIILSGINYLDVPLSYELDHNKAIEIMTKVADIASATDDVIRVEYIGIQDFDSSSINYRLLYECSPAIKGIISKRIRKILLDELSAQNISIPYNKIEIVSQSHYK